MRNLKTGRVWERTFKSGETLEGADVVDRDMQYLYNDGEFWHFMEPESFEQHQADKDRVGDAALWVKEQDSCVVTLYNGAPLAVTPANHVELEIVRPIRACAATPPPAVPSRPSSAPARP